VSCDRLPSLAVLLALTLASCGVEPKVSLDRPAAIEAGLTFDPTALPFPHPFMITSATTAGWPFVGTLDDPNPTADAPVNADVIAATSRFPLLILAPPDGRPDILAALRAQDGANLIMAWVNGASTSCVSTWPDAWFLRHHWSAVEQFDGDDEPFASCEAHGDGFLWMQDGVMASAAPHNLPVNVNLAKRIDLGAGLFQYVVAEAVADVIFADIYQSAAWDGIYIDRLCEGLLALETAASALDYARAGYGTNNADAANRTAFANGWQAGVAALATRLRSKIDAAGGSGFVLTGNCGPSPKALYPTLNGWMREGYPYQNGGSFYGNAFGDPGGYLLDETRFAAPQVNLLFTASQPTSEPYNQYNIRKLRFGLATAALGNGFHTFEDASAQPASAHFFDWRYDEYAVDLATARTSDASGRGWLGLAKGGVTQMIADNPSPELLPNGDFETNLAGWTFTAVSPAVASFDRAGNGAAEGTYSVHVNVMNLGLTDNLVSLVSSDGFALLAGREYSVTFWAMADARRNLTVAFDGPGASGDVSQTQPIGTAWQRFQVRLLVRSSASTASLRFDLGQTVGNVWLDGIHVQTGVTSVYRRDFDHGLVLVNPAMSDQDVMLERPFKKIRGTVDPETNDGAVVSEVHLLGAGPGGAVGDALFLLDVDTTPPAAITDLVVEP
jgi:hypothetical protein